VRNLEKEIENIIIREIEDLNRPDLCRGPIVAYSCSKDERYSQLKEIIGEWHLGPSGHLPDAESVISYFIPFTEGVIRESKMLKENAPLWAEAYVVINSYIDHINESVSNYLVKSGYSAKAIRATHNYDPKDMKSAWSHRSAAVIAGIGSFGANRVVITNKGSGGRFCTILTSAPLKTSEAQVEVKCLYLKKGSCGLCFRICPVNALSPDLIDKYACQEKLIKNGQELRQSLAPVVADTRGKCITVCPYAYIR